MPYAALSELPETVQSAYSTDCQRVFMRVWNDNAEQGEESAFRIAHTAARNCMEAMMKAVEPLKAERLGKQVWRVNALPFGGPLKGKDLQGEYFSARTDPKPEWFPEVPVTFQHTWDPQIKAELLGRAGQLEKENDGWWREFWLDRQSRYFGRIDAALSEGKLYGSSGAIPHMVKKASDGELLTWVPYEQTLSFVPVNPYSVVVPVKSLDLYAEAGISVSPAIKGLLTDLDEIADDLPIKAGRVLSARNEEKLRAALDEVQAVLAQLEKIADEPATKAEWSAAYIDALPDSAFACIDSTGRHYPHHDASGTLDLPHLRNALSRVAQDATTSCGKGHLQEHASMSLGD